LRGGEKELASKKLRVLVGPPRLTRYEKTRILATRVFQLSLGAPPLISVEPSLSLLEIAKRELESKVIPISIRRELPNGEYQDIPIEHLL